MALLESSARVEWGSLAPLQALTHLVSKYMRQLASGPTPRQLEIPRPDYLGQDRNAKDTKYRLKLDLDHRKTFDFAQLALATEPDASVAAELYESFRALAARLVESDDGPSSKSAAKRRISGKRGGIGRTARTDRESPCGLQRETEEDTIGYTGRIIESHGPVAFQHSTKTPMRR